MKRLFAIIFILFLTMQVFCQANENPVNPAKNFTSLVYVSLDTQGKISSDVLSKELVLELGNLKSLKSLLIDNLEKTNLLKADFEFPKMEDFYNWYDNQETKKMIEKLKTYFKFVNVSVSYTKTVD